MNYRHAFDTSPALDGLGVVCGLGAPLEFVVLHGIGLAAKGVIAAKSRIDRALYLRHATETAAKSGTPSPTDVATAWQIPRAPRTPAAALLLGDQLLAVKAPSAALHQIGADGRCHLVSRGGGLKEWLHNAAPSIPYSTATRYRRLAAHLRQWLQLPAEIPLSWLFPTAPSPATLTSSAPLRRILSPARSAFTKLLADYPTLARLQRRIETDLGLLPARLGIPDFTSYRDFSGPRPTPSPLVSPPKWNPTQTLLDLSNLSKRPKSPLVHKRRPTRRIPVPPNSQARPHRSPHPASAPPPTPRRCAPGTSPRPAARSSAGRNPASAGTPSNSAPRAAEESGTP